MTVWSPSKRIFDYPDILDTLFQYLEIWDLKKLRLTHKYLSECTKNALFSTCKVNTVDVDEFAESNSAKYVRKLEIRQYEDSIFDMTEEAFWHNMPTLREVEFTSVKDTCYEVGEVRVPSDLLAKLKRFSARVRTVQLPKSLPSTSENFELINCEFVGNPEALCTCRYSLRLYNVCLQLPLTLHGSLSHLDITCNVQFINLPPSLISLTYVRQYILPETLPSGLQYLDCSSNDWVSLPHLPSGLKYLDCRGNELISIGNLPSSLEVLICDGNKLKSLDRLPPSLKMLSCSNNPLEDYFSSSNSQPLPSSLKALSVRCGAFHKGLGNALPSSLLYFDCGYNELKTLPLLPPSLEELVCDCNKLQSLPPLPSTLQILYCSNNYLTSLPTLPESILLINADPGIPISPLPALRQFYRHKHGWENLWNWKNIYSKL